MEVYQLEESDEEVTVLVGIAFPKKAGRAAPGVRDAKSSESRKRRVVSTLNELN